MAKKRIMLKLTSLSLLSMLLVTSVGNRAHAQQSVRAKIDEYMTALTEKGEFSGSILVARNDTVIISKGYGLANHEHNVPNTPKTKFRLGSVTKSFTAIAIMKLQEEGKLNVNDFLHKYIPDYPNGDRISLHHLLTHTSGIPDLEYGQEYIDNKTKTLSLPEIIELFKHKPLEFDPGERMHYSSSGYLLLGYIIEKVSQKSFEDFIEENILKPLNMVNTGYDHHSTIIKNRADGYKKRDNVLVNADYADMSIPHAAGAMYSTVEDLYLLDRALYTEKLLKRSTLEIMFTPFEEFREFNAHYGYGWFIDERYGGTWVFHLGGIDGFMAAFLRYVDRNVCIVILSNFEFSKPRLGKLCAILFGAED